jgi:hypothetical protein
MGYEKMRVPLYTHRYGVLRQNPQKTRRFGYPYGINPGGTGTALAKSGTCGWGTRTRGYGPVGILNVDLE